MVPAILLAASALLPAPAASTERVARVRILAPEDEAARLLPYVELKEGEPFRPELIRHALELFYATGEFEDVRVWVDRSAEGVDVAFEPVPAPLLVAVEVDGDPVLTLAAVRRTSRLRDREPLWPDRLERAARDVGLALAALGYLEAQVTAEARPAPGGRSAVLHVHAGPLASVARIEVPGAPASLAARLRSRSRPRPGEPYRRARADETVSRLERVLRSAGYWRASVSRRESYDPHTARVTLAFEVTAGPRFSLEASGTALPLSTRRSLEKLIRDGGARTDVIEEAADRLEEGLRRSGHRLVRVVHREEERPAGVTLVYDVDPGPPAEVASVRIAGQEPARVLRLLSTRVGQPVQDRLLAEDARVIARALEDDGYPEVKVEAEVPEGGGAVPVVFRVRSGPQVRVGSVRVEPPALPSGVAVRELRLRVGEPYRLRDLARDREDLLSAFHDAGYPQVEITPEVDFSEGGDQAQVVLRVQPGEQVSVDHVVIAGLDVTREEVIRRELRVKEGGPLGLGPLLESQRRLGGLGIFERLSLTEMDPESRPLRSLVISAQEGPRTSVSPAIGYGERDGLRGSVEVTRRNLFGMDRSLSTFARVSFNGLRLLTTYREPYALGRPQEMFVTAFREEEGREAFDFVRYGALVQGARTVPRGWSFAVRYTYQRTTSFNIRNPDQVGREFTNSTLAGPSTTIINDTRDDALDPHRGRFLSADLQLSHAVLGGDSFAKTFLQAATYERLSPRVVLAVGGRLGLGRTFAEGRPFLPRPDRFYAGGDYSLRGFDLDTVGPTAPDPAGRPVATGGNALLLGSAELRLDAGHSFTLAAFSDIGNVYTLARDLTLEDLRYTAGLGLRYKSSVGPLRVDWGYKLNRRPTDTSAYEFHLTLGNAY